MKSIVAVVRSCRSRFDTTPYEKSNGFKSEVTQDEASHQHSASLGMNGTTMGSTHSKAMDALQRSKGHDAMIEIINQPIKCATTCRILTIVIYCRSDVGDGKMTV